MATAIVDFGIQEALQQLGVSKDNKGTSTGTNWFSSENAISSYSPVDGELIGTVATTTASDYENVVQVYASTTKLC